MKCMCNDIQLKLESIVHLEVQQFFSQYCGLFIEQCLFCVWGMSPSSDFSQWVVPISSQFFCGIDRKFNYLKKGMVPENQVHTCFFKSEKTVFIFFCMVNSLCLIIVMMNLLPFSKYFKLETNLWILTFYMSMLKQYNLSQSMIPFFPYLTTKKRRCINT